VFKTTETRLITTLRKVPTGTNGGVSLGGLIFSALGGLVIGVAYYVAILLFLSEKTLAKAPPQWPIMLMGLLGGFLGSAIDSLLGATLQYSGLDRAKGKVVERGGPKIEHICGIPVLDNCSVNLISSILNSFLLAEIGKSVWT
jgi:uncharacterized membrane protein